MKHTILLIVLLNFLRLGLYGQQILTTKMNATVYVIDISKAKDRILLFLKEKNAVISKQNESSNSLYLSVGLSEEAFNEVQLLIAGLGYITSKDIYTSNNTLLSSTIEMDLEYLKQQKEAYDTELKSMSDKGDRYYEFWEKIRELDQRIHQKTIDLKKSKEDSYFVVELSFYEEGSDMSTDVNWVNMPGASFDLFFPENPLSSLSASQYMGYSLKYLITRGKTYLTLGALKEYSTQSQPVDSMRYLELFHFGFGQDWYTKHFGRGKNKFMNLYTGYNFGGMFATADARKKTIFYANAFLGVELFKNKYMLLDNKLGYFVPFAYNRNLRGLTYSASFNFVF